MASDGNERKVSTHPVLRTGPERRHRAGGAACAPSAARCNAVTLAMDVQDRSGPPGGAPELASLQTAPPLMQRVLQGPVCAYVAIFLFVPSSVPQLSASCVKSLCTVVSGDTVLKWQPRGSLPRGWGGEASYCPRQQGRLAQFPHLRTP